MSDARVGLPPLVYIPRLDTFRAVAALMVVEWHYSLLPRRVLNTGGFGVWFFFVLSGFLITWLLLDDRRPSASAVLSRFYLRRAFRIFPLYYLAIGLGLGLGLPSFRKTLGWTLTYLTNVGGARGAPLRWEGHLWSLAVEEQFYVVWPAVLLLAPRRAWILAAALVPAAIAYKLVAFSAGDYAHASILTISCADALAVGALTALGADRLGVERTERVLRWLLPLSVPAFVIFVGHMSETALAFAQTGAALLFAWLVLRAVQAGPGSSSWGGSWLPALGRISYGIYVYHFIVLGLLNAAGPPTWSRRMAGAGATLVVAGISFLLFEQPIRSAGHKLTQRGQSMQVPASPAIEDVGAPF